MDTVLVNTMVVLLELKSPKERGVSGQESGFYNSHLGASAILLEELALQDTSSLSNI